MGDVGSIYVGTVLSVLEEVDQTEGDALYETDTEGVRFTFVEDVEFYEFDDDTIIGMVNDSMEVFGEQLMDALIKIRDELKEGAELAEVYDMYENQEPDWSV